MKNISEISCFVFDLDGTLYLGDFLFDGVLDLFSLLDSKNIPYYFLTNNSSKSGNSYVDKLHSFGLTEVDRNQVITSADIVIDFLKSKSVKKIFLIGTPDLEAQFIRSGFLLVKDKDDHPEFVVVGFDTTFTYAKAQMAVQFVREGTPLISTNEDVLCPLPDAEYIPDCASITALIETACGVKTQYFGKPQKAAVEFLEKHTGVVANNMAMVGDRLYTDMKMSEWGMNSILVLTGETRKNIIQDNDTVIVLNSVADIKEYL